MHYLRISLIVDSPEDLDVVRDALTNDLDCSLDGVCKVVNISHDKDLASVFVQGQSSRNEHQVLTPVVPSLPPDVATVLAQYNLTIPRPKKGEPEWKVPTKLLVGEIQGLHTLRGRVVLTNGIKAFLIREDGKWSDVHWNWFIPDDLDAIPEGIAAPFRESKSDKRTEQLFEGF